MNIGGSTSQNKNWEFTDIKVLGTWMAKDKEGRRGYIFVDGTQRDQWENKPLMVSLNGKFLEVKGARLWDGGEAALVRDDIGDEAAALLRQANFHAPASEQVALNWQLMENARVRLTLNKRGAETLRIAPDEAQIRLLLTRNSQPVEPRIPATTKRAGRPTNFGLLGAGAIWRRDLELGRYADFSQPGRYQIEVIYQLPAQNGGTLENPGTITLNFTREFEINVPRK